MSLLNEAVESKKFDVRVVERNISRGLVLDEDWKKVQAALPDDSDNADYMNLDTLREELFAGEDEDSDSDNA
ncbi:hypothetical protein WDW86_19840 [Bdellovibrionota bacterium FG-2]